MSQNPEIGDHNMSAIIKAGFTLIAAYLIVSQGNITAKKLTYQVKLHVLETIVRFNKVTRMETMSRRLTGYKK